MHEQRAIASMPLYVNVERINNELAALGIGNDGALTPAQLFPFDQYHYHGTDAVHAAAHLLGLGPTSHVLDVGSGLGGPARYLASTMGYHVTALELQGLRELRYVEGKNLLIEYRYAEGQIERLPDLVADLVRRQVDILVVSGAHATAAAKQATSTMPIVVRSAGDLVGDGLVASLAQPGGNITGSTDMAPDLSGKRLEFLREAVPQASRVPVLLHANAGEREELRGTETAAVPVGVHVHPVEVRDPQEFPGAYAAMTQHHAQAVILLLSPFTNVHRRQRLELATQPRLPSLCALVEWTRDGCRMSYGPDHAALWRRAATYVDQNLHGAKPADLPVEQPTKFVLAINLKTAKVLDLTLPPALLFQADEVIR